MNKRQARRMQSIRNKLMAAICMLLVSSIMMVSTTYAWFTLSTAPEVSGITTAVGANGNLEMALLPENGSVAAITSESGDGALTDAKLKNVTWGNLVDLSDEAYGLDQITLYPAELNSQGTKIEASMLKTPEYGPDGRVKELTSNTVTGIYDGKAFNQSETNRGVRAVGTASGMTGRQLAYRNAKSSASSYTERAKTLATQALANHGSKLASIAVKHATTPAEPHTQAEVGYLKAMITDLQSADGILAQIDKAYIQYIIAYAASAASDLEDLEFEAIKTAVESKATAQEAIDAIAGIAADNGAAFDLPDTLEAPISALNATRAKVATAAQTVGALPTDKDVTWNDIQPVVAALADANQMKLNGMAIDALMNDKDAAANSILKNGITLQVGTGAGVFADIADHCGDYSTSIVIDKVSYGGTTVTDMEANMETKSNLNPNYYLPAVGAVVTGAGSPAGGTAGDKPITDMYGYVIDLAFRTNAADSKLLLQTTPVDRIYGNDGVDETMGHGSTMTFQASTPNFSNDQVKSLMKAVEIVFFDSGTSEILATGSLAADTATLGADGLTAKILLSKVVIDYVQDNTNGNYKLVDGNYVEIGAGETDITEKYKQVMKEELVTTPSEAVIRPLTQNNPTAVSVLVYLDGNKVANKDVANATTSVTGKMNLQFASSATLVPMEYTPLKNQNPEVLFSENKVTVNEGASVAKASFRGKSVTINLTAPEGKVLTGVTGVTVGEKALESGTFTYSDGVLKFTYEDITKDTTVAITVTTGAAPTPETPADPDTPETPGNNG